MEYFKIILRMLKKYFPLFAAYVHSFESKYHLCPKIWLAEAKFICPKILLSDKKAIFFKKIMDDKDMYNTKNMVKNK